MDIIETIECLKLDDIDIQYVEAVWSQEFLGNIDLPDDYTFDRNYVGYLNDIIEAVEAWQSNATRPLNSNGENVQEEEKTWKRLIELKLNYKSLLAILWHWMCHGQRNKAEEVSRLLSLKSATLYFKLLAISGSRVFHAYHPFLCLKAITVLKFGPLTVTKQKKSKKSSNEDDLNDVQLNSMEMYSLTKELMIVLQAVQLFLTKFSLESEQDLLEEIVVRLSELTRLEMNSNLRIYFDRNRTNITSTHTSSLAFSAYECMKCLCWSQHGDSEEVIFVIMKHLSAGVLFNDRELSFREQCVIREHTVYFVKQLLVCFKEPSYRGITTLIKHVFRTTGERAEIRQKGKETIVEIMTGMPYIHYNNLVKWLFDCAHCDKASSRLFSLEIIFLLLHDRPQTSDMINHSDLSSNSENDNPGCSSDNISTENNNTQTSELSAEKDVMLHKYMLAIILARCRDISAIVRAKAISLLVQCLKSDNMIVRSLMNEIFVLNYEQSDRCERTFLNYKQIKAALKSRNNLNPLPGAGVIITELKNLACDIKVHVRKAALQALESIIKLNRSWLTGTILKMLGTSCRDPAVSIRKEMVQVLSDLLHRYPDDKELPKIWTKSVVPLVVDQEGKLQECVLKTMRFLILDNLSEYNQQQDNIWNAVPWQLLALIVQNNLQTCFMKACEIWVKQNEVRNSLVKDVCTHIGTENNQTAWIILYCLSLHMELKNPMFAADYYRHAIASNEENASLLVIVLEVLLSCCSHLHHDVKKSMADELISNLCNFSVPRELIRLNVEIAVELTYQISESKKHAEKKVKSWTGELLQLSQVYLEDKFQPNEVTKAVNEELFLRHLHTLGEAAIHNPKQITNKTFNMLQQFLFLPEKNGEQDTINIFITKALAVVSLGKLCILNPSWAKESTKPFIKLLKSTQNLPTLINVMYVLRDLCVRYGAMMEPYLPALWMSMKDLRVEVRLSALTCLVELLQGSYIKFRGAMFFHLLSMVRDSQEGVTELAIYFLQDCLLESNKNIMFDHFIEAFFHYNGYEGHEIYGKCIMNRHEKEVFLMKGEQYRKDREYIYGFMLQNMNDEQRMKCKNNLVMKILDSAAEGLVRLDEDGESVIMDAIHTLNSKDIHLKTFLQAQEDDSAAENLEKVTNLIVNAKNKAIKECEKTYMIEYIVPVVIHLKTVLQKKHSKLVPHLMLYLRDMMKEYKNEVNEIFAEDKQTAKEVLFDIEKLEKKRQCDNSQRFIQNSEGETSNEIPLRISLFLENVSPWIRRSLSPEISACYQNGGEEMVITYARNKLQHLRNQTGCSSNIRARTFSTDKNFITEPKEEKASEKGDDDTEERELNCDTGNTLEELESRSTMEENGEMREREDCHDEVSANEYEKRDSSAGFELQNIAQEICEVERTTVNEDSVAGTSNNVMEVEAEIHESFQGSSHNIEELENMINNKDV